MAGQKGMAVKGGLTHGRQEVEEKEGARDKNIPFQKHPY